MLIEREPQESRVPVGVSVITSDAIPANAILVVPGQMRWGETLEQYAKRCVLIKNIGPAIDQERTSSNERTRDATNDGR